MHSRRWILIIALLIIALAGCADDGQDISAEMALSDPTQAAEPVPTEAQAETATPSPTATVTPTPTPSPTATPAYHTLSVALPEAIDAIGSDIAHSLEAFDLTDKGYRIEIVAAEKADLWVRTGLSMPDPAAISSDDVHALGWRYLTAVVPFDTVRDEVDLETLQAQWYGQDEVTLITDAATALVLTDVWGPGSPVIAPEGELLGALEDDRTAIGIMPFDDIAPTYKVLHIDGVSPFQRDLDPDEYPLSVALWLEGADAAETGPLLAECFAAWSNRDPERLTELIMTGVTAMCRLTAARMEQHGVLYPALVVSDVLRAADITHVSNEVPFIENCPVNTARNNLTFCSDYRYWDALEAIGTDIVGLSGNHVNDYGYAGARESIAFYRDRGIPIYGSGLNEEEACAPLFMEHNGNRLAFIAALAFEPSYAWATDELPGACYFYRNKNALIEKIRELDADPDVDLISIELQYLETYHPYPTHQQVDEFRELREAGAHIVTGVQSHVPQSWEPYDSGDPHGPSIIVYGLGNFFFDQMWSWQTRTGLIARHMIYDGRLLNSEVLTTVLEDYAQPRWATLDEREEILTRIFEAAPARPTGSMATPAEQAIAVLNLALERWLAGDRDGAAQFGLRAWTDSAFDPVSPIEADVRQADWTIVSADGTPQQVIVRVQLDDIRCEDGEGNLRLTESASMRVVLARTYAGWRIRELSPDG